MLSNKSLKLILVLGMLLGTWALLSAWSITDSYFGNKYGSFDPRSFAMGSSGAYSDVSPFAVANNPANLSIMKKSLAAQVSMNFTRNEDNRTVPLYNSFDNYVDDAVYSSNTNAYDDYSAVGFASLSSLNRTIGIGFYTKPLLSFDADYREEVRDNYGTDNDIYPKIIAMNQMRNTGTLDQQGIVYSFSYAPTDVMDISLGFDYSFLKGEIEQVKSIRWTDSAIASVTAINSTFKLPDYVETLSTKLDGYQIKLGTAIKLSNRLGIGFVYVPKATLSHKGSFTIDRTASSTADSLYIVTPIDEEFILPTEMRLGFSYKPQNIMRTWFNIDIEQVKWSEINTAYDDVFNLYAGVEHHVENRYPLRLGFQAVNSWIFNIEQQVIDGISTPVYITKKIITPMFTAGSSIEVMKNVKLDLGFGYSWREYEALDMFGDAYYNDKTHTGHTTSLLWRNPQYLNFTNRGWENPDKVRESFITLSTGLSITW